MAKEMTTISTLIPEEIYGEIGDSYEAAVRYFYVRGIDINNRTVFKWRSGSREGTQLARRAQSINTLLKGSSEQGYTFLQKIVEVGLDVRQTIQFDRNPQGLDIDSYPKYQGTHLTDTIATELGADPQLLRKIIRNIRAEFIVQAQHDPLLHDLFLQTANLYLIAQNNDSPSQISDCVKNLDLHWNRESISQFYRILYQHGPLSRGVFFAYELDFLKVFLKKHIQKGSKITEFTRDMLDEYALYQSTKNVRGRLTETTGIPFSVDGATLDYIDAINNGLPLIPSKE